MFQIAILPGGQVLLLYLFSEAKPTAMSMVDAPSADLKADFRG